jgi:hypothetical protein
MIMHSSKGLTLSILQALSVLTFSSNNVHFKADSRSFDVLKILNLLVLTHILITVQ